MIALNENELEQYIHKHTGIDLYIIIQVLECELDYLKLIGIAEE